MINNVLNIDCVHWLKSYIGKPFADLMIIDPPFNISWSYDIYIDKMSDNDFIEWNKSWISLSINKILKPTGQIMICMGDEYISEIDILCRKELKLYRQNWLVWHYEFGQSGKLHTRKRFTRSKTHILRFSKHRTNYTFNATQIAVPSFRQTKYGDKRADDRGKCPNDVFINKRIAGTHKDRFSGMSTQMPQNMIETWISAMSNPGDMVVDLMCGSGVVLAAAKRLNRQYFGCELSPSYHERVIKRLSITAHNNNLSLENQL